MQQLRTFSFLSTLALLSSCAGRGDRDDPFAVEASVEEATAFGTAVLPLTATVHGVSYRLRGMIEVDALSPLGAEHVHSQRLDGETSSMVVLSLPVGAYDVRLHDARLFRSGAEGDVEVTFTLPADGAIQRIVVSEQVASNVAWWFEAADTLVPLDPCFVHPDVIDCARGDLDGDGVANGAECSNPMACVDTDGDGVADVSDMDSDDDTYTDGFDDGPLDPCVPHGTAPACTNARTRASETSAPSGWAGETQVAPAAVVGADFARTAGTVEGAISGKAGRR